MKNSVSNGPGVGIKPNRTANVNPCEPRWEPIEDEPTIFLPPYVINNLTNPCLNAALIKLSSGTSNTFFKQIYNTFDTSTVNNLEINESNLIYVNAYGLASPPLQTPNGVAFVITLYTVDLLNCSQEWMAYIMIHEVAHAAMFANAVQWDTTNTQHIALADQFLTLIANSLMASYPSLPELDVYAICFPGFFNGVEGNPHPQNMLFLNL